MREEIVKRFEFVEVMEEPTCTRSNLMNGDTRMPVRVQARSGAGQAESESGWPVAMKSWNPKPHSGNESGFFRQSGSSLSGSFAYQRGRAKV